MAGGNPITFVDVETTGLSHEDRVVSIGIVYFADDRMLETGSGDVSATHLVFNPGRPSHPRARKVHGYSDAELGLQEPFAAHAEALRKYFEHPGRVVAHNASFDRRFVANEFKAARLRSGERDYFCTMLAHRQRYGAKSGLDAVLAQMGAQARGERHGALQDAWHAMEVYSWLHGIRVPETLRAADASVKLSHNCCTSGIAHPCCNSCCCHQPKRAGVQPSLSHRPARPKAACLRDDEHCTRRRQFLPRRGRCNVDIHRLPNQNAVALAIGGTSTWTCSITCAAMPPTKMSFTMRAW